MKQKYTGEKRQIFSMRKLSVGLVSVIVGNFFLMGTGFQTVSAKNVETSVQYKYVTESELSEEEKTLLVKELPQLAEEYDDAYYLVYRPEKFLPKTGMNATVDSILMLSGLGLLVVVVTKGKNKKKKLVHMLMLTSMGVQLIPTNVFAISNEILSSFNTQFSIEIGDHLPKPLEIEGFQYIGYLKTQKPDTGLIIKEKDESDQSSQNVESNDDFYSNEANISSSVSEGNIQTTNTNSNVIEKEFTNKPSVEVVENERRILIPYTTDYIEDPTVEIGHTQVFQKGVNGEQIQLVRQYLVEGKIEKSEIISEIISKEPVKEIIKVGTKKNTGGSVVAPAVLEIPRYNEQLHTKGTQEIGHEGEAVVQNSLPEYSAPLSTKGTQEVGHEGEAVVQNPLPEYTNTVSTKGTQELGREGEATVQQSLSEYVVQVTKNGTQEKGQEGKAAVQAVKPEYTQPLETKGTQEVGHEGEAVVQEAKPEYTQPLETKGTQEVGHEGEAVVQSAKLEYTQPLETKGTQEADHEGEAVVQSAKPEYTQPLTTKGTQDLGHEGEAAVEAVLPEYTEPVSTKGTQEVGHEGESTVETAKLEYTQPLTIKGTQEVDHEGEALTNEPAPEFTGSVTLEPAKEEELPTLEVVTRNRTETKVIPFTTEEIKDNTLLKNRRVTEQVGKNGTETIELEDYLVNGNVEASKEISRTVVEPVKEIVKVGTFVKTKPTVDITNVTRDESKKSISVRYHLTDTTKAYVSAKAQIFQGNQLIKEVTIENPEKEQVINGLDYYTPYTIKTHLTYNLAERDEENTEASTRDFQLDYKKIEIKDIDSVELYGKEDGHYRRYLDLETIPTDTSKYFVKVKSDRFKEIYLPVKSITANEDGTYKVKANVDQLVEQDSEGYREDYSFTISKAKEKQTGVYTSFKQLISAMQSNLSGVYKLSSNMTADEVSLEKNQTSYINGAFTGRLEGTDGVKSYAIYDLKKPLFSVLDGATIRDLDLKNTNVDSKENAAALSKSANNTTISNVAVEGKISSTKSVAGIVVTATNTTIENSSFKGKIVANHADNGTNYAGGIAGYLTGKNSKIDQTIVDATISTAARNNNQTTGGIVGKVDNAGLVTRSVSNGKILNGQGYARVGGIAGSTYSRGKIDNVVSNMNVGDGYAITGDQYSGADVKNAITSVENNQQDRFATKVSKEEVDAKIASFGITVSLDDTNTGFTSNNKETDYTRLSQAQTDRKIAYQNIEKLMPFYNKELVVYYGNKVATTDKLYTTELLDVVPMKDHEVVTDLNANKNSINKVMLHFRDNTVQYLNVSFKENFKNDQVVEYNVADKEYIYTPEAFISEYSAITNNVISELQHVSFNSDAMKSILGVVADAELDKLYLDKEFENVKANVAEHLRKVLAMDTSINTTGDGVVEYISEKIKTNKEAFMLGLTYLNRWYNINYDHLNTKDLSVYKFDFNGNNAASTLDTIIALGNSGLENLRGPNTVGLYSSLIAPLKGEDTVFDFVEAYRKLFLPEKTNNQWLKDNSKAYIVESPSKIDEVREKQTSLTADKKYSIGVYDRISSPNWKYKNMLLPLLTMKDESVYAISTISTLSFGSYEGYKDRVNGVVLSGDALKQYVRGKVDQAAEWQRDHYDIWYKMLTPESKEKLYRAIPVTDSFDVKNSEGRGYWATATDKNIDSIYNFFGPSGRWHAYVGGVGAYAIGTETFFIIDRLLSQYGTSVYSHEMVHNSDSSIYFEGNGRREGQGAELYAYGLLQSADTLEKEAIVLNTIFKGDKDSKTRLHTYDPTTRFTSEADVQSYLHGMYDVLYTLDAMEAKSIVSKSDTVKKKWFRKIENYYVHDERNNIDTHAGNKVRQLTDAEVSQLTSLEALIDADIINRRAYRDSGQYGRNGYYAISMFSPIYASLSNSKGAPGDIMFRKIAYELFAEKGYHNGFLPYVSNQYASDALAEESKTYSSWFKRDVALITDDLLFKKVFNNQYANWSEFKKDMFNKRIVKQEFIKPITIQYELDKPNSTKEITISNAQEMQALINAAVEKDIQNIDRATENVSSSWVHLLKQKIYNAYLRLTDDFRGSIYK